jgi:hypothetical protein
MRQWFHGSSFSMELEPDSRQACSSPERALFQGAPLVDFLVDVNRPPSAPAWNLIDEIPARCDHGGRRRRCRGAAIIQRISALTDIVPELCELDLNPVKLPRPGEGAVVVDGTMRIAPTVPPG